MKEKLNFKNLFMIVAMLFATVSFTSCATGSEESEYPEDDPATTGLCGIKWVLQSATGGDSSYSAYYFDYTKRGYSEIKNDEGEIERTNFTWVSYNTGSTTHILTINIGGAEYYTYYVVSGNTLRITSGSGVLEYVPEDQYISPDDNGETSEDDSNA